jgi:hypothetical protein
MRNLLWLIQCWDTGAQEHTVHSLGIEETAFVRGYSRRLRSGRHYSTLAEREYQTHKHECI